MQVLQQLHEKIGIGEASKLIKEKQAQYFNLLTEEAAGKIIAFEKGLQVAPTELLFTDLTSLAQGERVTNVFIVNQFSEPRRFVKDNREGHVMTLFTNSEISFPVNI